MKKTKEVKKTMIGGQALIEGIMMKGPDKIATVCRTADGGFIEQVDEYKGASKNILYRIPVVRGVISFGSMMKIGVKALEFSAKNFTDEDAADVEQTRFEKWLERRFGNEKVEKFLMGFAVVIGLAFPVVLYFLLPALLAGFFKEWFGIGFVRNLVEGALRLVIFLLFLFSVSHMKEMKRVFSYHGAEHKTIACYEAGEKLTVENVKKYTRKHPRCGTSFLFVVMIISVIVLSFMSLITPLTAVLSNVFLRTLVKLVMILPIVGISYEINRFVGRHDNIFTRILRWPGVALQAFTTYEPDDGMIEVGIRSLTLVLPEDAESDRW